MKVPTPFRIYFLSLLFIWPSFLCAQKFHFQNYNVQQGLIQSQVIAIAQDHFDNLWFCTLGGISRFDGKSFTNYSETDGLISNYTTNILADQESNMWIGTANGISKFNGNTFKNIQFTKSLGGNSVRGIKEDRNKKIWVLAGGKLYHMNEEKAVRDTVFSSDEIVTAIQTDEQGNLYAALVNKGVYTLEQNKWKLYSAIVAAKGLKFYSSLFFDPVNKKKLYYVSPDSMYTYENGVISPMFSPGKLGRMKNMFIDRSNKIWLTGTEGLFQYSDSGLVCFNEANGYEGNGTEVIFQDRENNIWLGTNGTGVFRYSYQPFLIFDQFNAAKNKAVMPMLEDHDLLYLGTDGAGLFVYDGKEMKAINEHSDMEYAKHINGLFRGYNGEIYILSAGGMVSEYKEGKITPMRMGELKGCINDILPDEKGGFWVAGCYGFFYIQPDGQTKKIFEEYGNKILRFSPDSLMVATDEGMYLVGPDFKYKKVTDSLLGASKIMALSSLGKYFLLATSNKGFIMYDHETGARKQFTTKEGLNADFIYSVTSDQHAQIWLGTGRGTNKLKIDSLTGAIKISSLSIPGDISSAESNQEGIVYDLKKNLWVGTVSGLFKYAPDSVKHLNYLPPVVLQQVQVFSKDVPVTRFSGLENYWYSIPTGLVLKHDENHLTFSFRCPSYLHSESIQYQYQLEGMEKTYSALTSNHFVVYPSLPPGHYVFRARAFVEGVGYSTENINFAFDIRAAFYQTLYFKLFLLAALTGIVLWIQWIRIRMRIHNLQHIEEAKREENIKVRQTASEDFHDEVGNSLTRIQVLTDVLQTKLGNGHDEEKRIIGQIKENVSGLYQGTRDILWALNPESDMIKEIGQRLESLGIDVFQDTGICFSYENKLGEAENLKLPGNYNRNIMMIFKEAMSNSLKHAQAHRIDLSLQKSSEHEILIRLTDDGIGFNPLYIKKGHGFQNMQKRATRINSFCSVLSSPGEGSSYELRIPILTA